MRIYIAGKLRNDNERDFLEKLAKLCEDLGFETFLPHRDVGLAQNLSGMKLSTDFFTPYFIQEI